MSVVPPTGVDRPGLDRAAGRESDLGARRKQVAPATPPLLYGQSARFVREVQPAADVVRTISRDAETLLRTRPDALVHRT